MISYYYMYRVLQQGSMVVYDPAIFETQKAHMSRVDFFNLLYGKKKGKKGKKKEDIIKLIGKNLRK